MELLPAAARVRYEAFVAAAPQVVVGLDFDGTLAPIVADPDRARLHPEVGALLRDLAARVAALVVVTGRPVDQVVSRGGVGEVGSEIDADGHELHVVGQYGHERWSSREAVTVTSPAPPGLAALERELPAVLARCRAAEAHVERKGLGVAVHTRQLPDPEAAWARLQPELRALAEAHGLVLEPGRHVLELRSGSVSKGDAVRGLVAETGAQGCCFVGDDLGDLDAFDAVAALTAGGVAGLCVCSGSDEVPGLAERADLVVAGPDGVVAFLRRLVTDLPACCPE